MTSSITIAFSRSNERAPRVSATAPGCTAEEPAGRRSVSDPTCQLNREPQRRDAAER